MTWEMNFLSMLESIRTPFLNKFFELVTMLGEDSLLVVIIAVIYYALDKSLAKKLFFTTLLSLGINGLAKNTVKRPRPFANGKIACVRPKTATGYSLPSGHTQTIATWSTALASHFKKTALIIFASVSVIAVAFSRMYLGAHFPLDAVSGAILGIVLALSGTYLYDKAKDKNTLFLLTLCAFTPGFAWFLIKADPLFEDFFKVYGMLAGLWCASVYEEKFVKTDYTAPAWKKLLRIIIGVAVALAVKKIFPTQMPALRFTLIMESVKYLTLVFTVMAICPLIYKKIKL